MRAGRKHTRSSSEGEEPRLPPKREDPRGRAPLQAGRKRKRPEDGEDRDSGLSTQQIGSLGVELAIKAAAQVALIEKEVEAAESRMGAVGSVGTPRWMRILQKEGEARRRRIRRILKKGEGQWTPRDLEELQESGELRPIPGPAMTNWTTEGARETTAATGPPSAETQPTQSQRATTPKTKPQGQERQKATPGNKTPPDQAVEERRKGEEGKRIEEGSDEQQTGPPFVGHPFASARTREQRPHHPGGSDAAGERRATTKPDGRRQKKETPRPNTPEPEEQDVPVEEILRVLEGRATPGERLDAYDRMLQARRAAEAAEKAWSEKQARQQQTASWVSRLRTKVRRGLKGSRPHGDKK